jgi:hypothetical protein
MADEYQRAYPESSQAVLVLVLGIIGLVLCQLTAPIAWVLGRSELQAVAEGRRPPGDEGLANAGRILGIVGTVLLAFGILMLLAFFAFGIAATMSDGLR